LKSIFSAKDKLTALFAHDDYLAARVIVTLNNLNLKESGDVSIIALGDTLDNNQPFIPRIIPMSINTDLLGKIGGELMIKWLKDKPGHTCPEGETAAHCKGLVQKN
jgi:DNA-binding LacI/PurR family transcriptional regulator